MQVGSDTVFPRPRAAMDDGAGAVDALRTRLLDIVHISETPMRDAVARLDTRGSEPVLYLDPNSPPEDQVWAMRDVLRILHDGPEAGQHAIPTPNLHLIHG